MAKRTAKPQAYYQEHRKDLEKIIALYNRDRLELFSESDYAIFNTIQQGITRFPLRYYQMEALYVLDHLYQKSQAELRRKQGQTRSKFVPLISGLLDTIEKKQFAPFLGYEMATGSGKTLLMGASIYLLNQKFGVNNFLIITPPSKDIYQKTIRNFTLGNYESVWADDTSFNFNLITGDNYAQNLFYKNEADANIFVFNISKFGSNATNTEKTWESAVWKDDDGNSISIKQYLKDKKLVIITDEAHHAQNRASSKIIKNFHPNAVLEFTATAVEDSKKAEKKNQTIVFKYDIRKLLEDGHGKLVRAVALANQDIKTSKDAIAQSEKLKLVTVFLIHLLKKKAVLLDSKAKGLKPVAFVKVKDDTKYTQKVYEYIQNDLANDVENIEVILEKITEQSLEITDLLQEMWEIDFQKDLGNLQDAIASAAKTAIFYHGKSGKEVEKKFLEIRKNEVEIVVYMQKLDEGIDLPNIYSMAVINDNVSDFKTSVKQIIGRGVRINKDKREFDDIDDVLLQQAEKLHIVCDQGKNFEEVIMAIQKEFGLTDKYLSTEKLKQRVINRVSGELLDKKYVPHIKADFRIKEGVNLYDLLNDTETIVQHFIENNCFSGPDDDEKRFVKYRPDSFFQEVDIFADKSTYHKQLQQSGGVATPLIISAKEVKKIYGHVLGSLYCMPDTRKVKKAFQEYADRFNEVGLKYYQITPSDETLALNLFVNAFSFYYRNHIEKNYFEIEFRELRDDDSWNLKKNFKDYDIKIPVDQIKNSKWKKETDKAILRSMVDAGYHFFGYDKSVFEYDKFDSYTEKQLADFVDSVVEETGGDSPFWIRNMRNIYFTYGSKRYYPDFILYKEGITYIIETKGEIYSDTRKNMLLRKLDEIDGYRGVLVFSQQLNLMDGEEWTFEQFMEHAEEIIKKGQQKEKLVDTPKEEEKFVKYIPAYSPLKAHKKFIKEQKTPKPVGWLSVPESKYPKTVFATQVKGKALAPNFVHNDWLVLDANYEPSEIDDKLALVFSKNIEDEYDGNTIIRKIQLEERRMPGQMFGRRFMLLKSLNDEVMDMEIDMEEKGRGADIVGVEYEG